MLLWAKACSEQPKTKVSKTKLQTKSYESYRSEKVLKKIKTTFLTSAP
jgi:hypothetical protein